LIRKSQITGFLLFLVACAGGTNQGQSDQGAGTDSAFDAEQGNPADSHMSDGSRTDGGGAVADGGTLDAGGGNIDAILPGPDAVIVDMANAPDTAPVPDADPMGRLPLPDARAVVEQLAAERPEQLANSCVRRGGTTEFLFELVRRLRAIDQRWGLNWKRGQVNDLSHDVVDYFYAPGEPSEGRTEVYIIRIISNQCPEGGEPPPAPAWLDLTQATADAGTVGRWTIAPLGDAPVNPDPDPQPGERAPLPDERAVIEQVANEHPEWLEQSCVRDGGNNNFLFEVVRRLRAIDERWGLNWKRGDVGNLSQEVVDYYWGPGRPSEGSTDVYIIDIIVGHCPEGGDPPSSPGWIDQTQATADAGAIGRWTIRPLNP